jgi:PAS domain S-box-containing protein
LFIAFGERKLLSCGFQPPNFRKNLKFTLKKVNPMFGLKKSPSHTHGHYMKANYYKLIVGLAAGLTLGFLFIWGWQSYLSCHDFHRLITIGESINESNALIGQLDEALTMSARMAAATGERQWEARYRLLEPQLDEAIRKVKQLAPDLAVTKGVQKTDEANQTLVEMEYRSFKLIGEGRQDAARALLSSREYEEAKHIYAMGLRQIREGQSGSTRALLQLMHDRLELTLTLLGTILPLLLVLWAWVIRTARNSSAKQLAAENALRESDKRFRAIFNSTYQFTGLTSPAGKLTEVNRMALDFAGLNLQDVIDRPFWETHWWKGNAERMRKLEESINLAAQGEFIHYEVELQGAGNMKGIFDFSIKPIFGRDGNAILLLLEGNDITERKRAADILQARLRLSEFALTHSFDELLQKMLDEAELLTGSVIGFFHLVDSDQKTLLLQAWSTNTIGHMCTAEGKGQHYDINKAGVWADCLRERRPVIHNDYASLPHRKGLPPGHAPILRQLAVPVLRGEQITAILGVGNKATDYTAEDIKIVSVLADLVWDITERKRFERELEDSRQQLETILDITKTGIDIVDSDYNLLYVDPGWQKTYGAPKGRKCFEYFMGRELPCQGCGIPIALKTKEVQITEETLVRENNRIVEVHTIPFLDKSGKWVVAEFNVDINERKRLEFEKAKIEEQNRQLQKAESLGRMSGAIAHIFNNQLQIVIGYLGMVIPELPPDDSRAVKLVKSMQAAIKASEVSGYLLAYLGQKQVKPEVLDLSELCRTSLPLLQAGKPESIALETDLPSPGPCIRADAKQIQQILTNIVINAREAIGASIGTIRLTVKTVSGTDIPAAHRFPLEWQSQDQQYVCMEVKDSGCGIKEKDMEKLFDPFFSTKFTGRGLGLPVVFGIVRAHGGGITVESGIDSGSVFKVFFPILMQIASR